MRPPETNDTRLDWLYPHGPQAVALRTVPNQLRTFLVEHDLRIEAQQRHGALLIRGWHRDSPNAAWRYAQIPISLEVAADTCTYDMLLRELNRHLGKQA